MNRSWTIHESSVNLSWVNHGWCPGVPSGVLAASWLIVESVLNHSWIIFVAIMNQSIMNKSFLNQSWIIYESIMNHSWIIRESLMHHSWIIQKSSIHNFINHSFRNHLGIIHQSSWINHWLPWFSVACIAFAVWPSPKEAMPFCTAGLARGIFLEKTCFEYGVWSAVIEIQALPASICLQRLPCGTPLSALQVKHMHTHVHACVDRRFSST